MMLILLIKTNIDIYCPDILGKKCNVTITVKQDAPSFCL